MSELKDGVFYVQEEAPKVCTSCGKLAELRPYGKDGAEICFKCGTKDLETTNKHLEALLFKATKVVRLEGGSN